MADPARLTPGELARGARLVCGRELAAIFEAPIAPIVAGVFLLLSCTTFMNGFFLAAVADMSAYFELLPFLLIPFIPAITMRLWAEERSQNTFEFIMTLPLEPVQLVAGKYLAALAFYLLALLGTLPIVIMLFALGDPDPGRLLASYLGAALLGGFFLAVGAFVSSLTRDQIVAFVLATLLGFVFVLSGHPKVVEVLDGLQPRLELGTWLYQSVSVLPHYASFGRGVIGLADVAYFVLLSGVFLGLNALALKRLRS